MDSTQADLLGKYVKAVQLRDAARKAAEAKDKERRKAWREFYEATEVMESVAKEAGLIEVGLFDECPPAPKKRKQN